MHTTEWSTLKSAGRHMRSYLSYHFVRRVWWFLVLILVPNANKRITLTRLYLEQALMFLESYTSIHCTVQNPCAQRSRISLTPIRTIHFTVYYTSIWTSGRQRVDCFCPRFDAIGHRLWVVLPKVAKVLIQFWCMLTLRLGPTKSRLNPNHTPTLTSTIVSKYCCHLRNDRLLYCYVLNL